MTTLVAIILIVAAFITGFFIGKNSSNSANFNKAVTDIKSHVTDTVNSTESAITSDIAKVSTKIDSTVK